MNARIKRRLTPPEYSAVLMLTSLIWFNLFAVLIYLQVLLKVYFNISNFKISRLTVFIIGGILFTINYLIYLESNKFKSILRKFDDVSEYKTDMHTMFTIGYVAFSFLFFILAFYLLSLSVKGKI